MAENVVLLTVDALRVDHLSCYGYGRETTPYIDEFADDAMVFENAFSASSHTREAVPALLTGRYPEESVAADGSLDRPTVATYLRETHRTAAFHSNPYLSRAYGYDDDFDRFYDDLRLGRNRYLALIQRALDKYVFSRGTYHARADRINELSLSWLNELDQGQPFFLWNHYMDVHGPYNPPKSYTEFSTVSVSNSEAQRLYDRASKSPDEISGEERDLLRDLYDDEIRYLDAQVGELLENLERGGFLDETVIIVTSDHGDAFGENGYFAHPRSVDEELVRVPMILAERGAPSGVVTDNVSTIDVLPTILSAVGQAGPDRDLPGVDIRHPSNRRNRMVYTTAAGEGEDMGTRVTSMRDDRREVRIRWDLSTGEPISEEIRHLSGRHEEEMKESSQQISNLRTELYERFGDLSDIGIDDTRNVPASVEDRLEALGYQQ